MSKYSRLIATVVIVIAVGVITQQLNLSNQQRMALDQCGITETNQTVDSTRYECIVEQQD